MPGSVAPTNVTALIVPLPALVHTSLRVRVRSVSSESTAQRPDARPEHTARHFATRLRVESRE
jgi:hypothetical protein